eukprot:753645-Hanusia_phi.AAC.3
MLLRCLCQPVSVDGPKSVNSRDRLAAWRTPSCPELDYGHLAVAKLDLRTLAHPAYGFKVSAHKQPERSAQRSYDADIARRQSPTSSGYSQPTEGEPKQRETVQVQAIRFKTAIGMSLSKDGIDQRAGEGQQVAVRAFCNGAKSVWGRRRKGGGMKEGRLEEHLESNGDGVA